MINENRRIELLAVETSTLQAKQENLILTQANQAENTKNLQLQAQLMAEMKDLEQQKLENKQLQENVS